MRDLIVWRGTIAPVTQSLLSRPTHEVAPLSLARSGDKPKRRNKAKAAEVNADCNTIRIRVRVLGARPPPPPDNATRVHCSRRKWSRRIVGLGEADHLESIGKVVIPTKIICSTATVRSLVVKGGTFGHKPCGRH